MIRAFRWCVLTRVLINWSGKSGNPSPRNRANRSATITNIGAMAPVICLCSSNPHRVAACGGHRPAHQTGLRPVYAAAGRWVLSRGRGHPASCVDNLNTHTPASLYETFPPAEAHRILQRLEFHYTPKHGSWLNMVEIEFSVLTGQCLQRRLPDKDAGPRGNRRLGAPTQLRPRQLCSGASPQTKLAPNSSASTPHNPCGEVVVISSIRGG